VPSASKNLARTFAGSVGLGSAAAIGLVAGVASLLRLWLGSSSSITQNLWAEDGLFALCIRKADFATCTAEPFAGYLILAPRLLALPTALAPFDLWALTANLVAAVLAGAIAAAVFYASRRFSVRGFTSAGVALLPVIAPVSGLEALNAIGSAYMLLLYGSTFILVFPHLVDRTRVSVALPAFLLFLTALTIPTAVLLLGLLFVQRIRGVIGRRVGVLWGASLTIGLVPQFGYVFLFQGTRPNYASLETLNFWADSLPLFLFSYWPGLSLGEFSFHTEFTLAPFPLTGWLLTLALAASAIYLVATGWNTRQGRRAPVGLLILLGLGFSLIPSLTSYANNRYFVVAVWLIGAAVIVSVDRFISDAPRVWLGLACVVVAIVWSPAFPASAYRSHPSPPCSGELARAQEVCESDTSGSVDLEFSPNWPYPDSSLPEPSNATAPCVILLR